MPSRILTLTNSYLYSAIGLSSNLTCCRRPQLVRARITAVRPQDVAGERHLQNLDRSFGDHHAALVSPEFLDRQIGRESHAAVDFHAAVGGMERLAVAENLGHVGLGADVAALIVLPGGVIDHQAKLVHLHEAVRQHPLHGLAVGQRLAEGDALLGVARAELEAALDHADAARAVADAADVEPMLRVAEALALLADAVLDRHLDVLESDLPRPVVDHQFLRAQQLARPAISCRR